MLTRSLVCLLARSSHLKVAFPSMWFVGFYSVKEEGKVLQIGPYQGPVLATGIIQFGRGKSPLTLSPTLLGIDSLAVA